MDEAILKIFGSEEKALAGLEVVRSTVMAAIKNNWMKSQIAEVIAFHPVFTSDIQRVWAAMSAMETLIRCGGDFR